MSDAIPVIGTLIVNTPYWLVRLIGSIDYPVDEFVIFNNNGRDQITEELDNISKLPHKFIKKIRVCHLPSNLGCATGWNLIIKSYIMAPYWIIVNHDIAFSSGFLQTMVEKSKDPEVGIVLSDSGQHGVGSWDIFLLKDWVIKKYGLFDENFYPGYGEDTDYHLRQLYDPVKRDFVNLPRLHGEKDYATSGSQTWRSELELKDKIDYARYINENEYLNSKWGEGWRWLQPYKTPFNQNFPSDYITYDIDFIRKKHLGF